ncbi:MAG: lysophospholipid acyltransferase family protein [Candidatus Delongbacteria bacterium]|jgi:1-acyl-sn-glycerol-3-phosphate acyltransferase|nr:lysophospholipid acyltransferase family protein [Candidatus Delongbacteria bacterium]
MLTILKIKVISYTILYIFLLPYIYFLKLFKDEKYIKTFAHNLAKKWGLNAIKWSNTNVKLIGAENLPNHPVVIISNHQAHFDIMLLFGFTGLSPSFIAKKELGRIPLFATWMKILGCIFIDRSSARKALASFQEGAKKIKNGQTIIIFPEGTRRKEILPFKKGSFKLPIMAEVPILPITIIGSENIVENVKKNKPTDVTIVISPEVNIHQMDKDQLKNIHTEIRDLIVSNFEKYSEKSQSELIED